MLFHGDPRAIENLENLLKRDPHLTGSSVMAPEIGEIYELDPKEIISNSDLREILLRLEELERRISRLEEKQFQKPKDA